MNTVIVENCKTLFIGRRGENEVTEVLFDFSEWQEQFGAGVIDLYVKRNLDIDAYPVVLSVDGTVATWLVTAADTDVVGNGKIEYVYTVNEKIAKSAVFQFFVGDDIGESSPEPPEHYQSWLEQLTELGAETQTNAQAAAQSASEAAESAGEAAESAGEAAESAGEAAEIAAQVAEDSNNAEAWAVGERNGEPVSEGDPTYNNNAKYWAENAMTNAPVQSVNGEDGDVVLTLDDIPNGETYVHITPEQLAQIADNSDDIADVKATADTALQPDDLRPYRTAAAQDAIDQSQNTMIGIAIQSKQAKITASGILKGDGAGGVSAAVAGTDYATPQQVNAKYTKPADGIPSMDMTAAVQASLQKADTALQAVPDTYRTAADQDLIDNGKQAKITASGILKGDGAGGVSAAVAGVDYLKSAPVTSVNGQTGDVTIQPATDAQVTTAVNTWLGENVAQETGYVLDASLTMSNAAPPASAVGDLKSAIEKNNSVNILDNVAVSTSTTNGITFSVIDTQTINVAGTSTALANKDIYSSQTMPEWLEKGKQYYLEYSTPSGNVLFRVYIYRNGTLVSTALVEAVSNQAFTIPTDATGIIFRLAVKKSLTVNENVTFAVLNAKSNLQLSNNIENLYPVILTTNSADAHNETINLLNPNTITEGYFLSNNIPVANSSFYYSDYIEIGMNRFCFSQVGSVSGQVNCYDFNKNYIGTIDYSKNTDHFVEGNEEANTNLRFRTFTPLDGTVYIRVCGGISRPKMVTPFFSPMDYGATAQNLPYGKIFRKYGKRVAMFGDSITLGTNGNGGGTVEKNLSFYLESLTGWVVENYGVGSQGWVSTQYTNTIAYDKISTTDLTSYDIITLCYGVNDTGSTLGNYDSTDETTICGQINKCINYILTQNNKAIVILIAPFNTAGNGSFPNWRYPVVISGWSRTQLAEKEKEIAAYYHIPFISQDDSPFNGYGIGTPDGTRTNQFIGTDNVHPTPDGYKVEGHWLTAKIKSFVY